MTVGPEMTTSPVSPVGTILSFGSMIAMTWPGMGGPTVPSLRVPSIGLQAEQQVPSVRPYPSMMTSPKRSSDLVSNSWETGAAPHTANRSDEVSGMTSAGSAASRAKIVGTPEK